MTFTSADYLEIVTRLARHCDIVCDINALAIKSAFQLIVFITYFVTI